VNNVSSLIPLTLGELNEIGCPGREHRTGLICISTNAIDAAAELRNNNLNNTLPKDVHVSLKDHDRVYFTVFRLPPPVGIHYLQVPDFSQYADATPQNIKSD